VTALRLTRTKVYHTFLDCQAIHLTLKNGSGGTVCH